MTQVYELYADYFNKNCLDTVDNSFIEIINTKKPTIDTIIEDNEINYIEKMKEIKESYNVEKIKSTYINKTALEIIQKESEIIKLISKYSLQNNKLEYNFVVACLKYLFELSNILRIRLKQPIINISKQNKNNIVRCSYKFCNFKDSCVYNYSKKGNCCYQDHYVHHMVSADLKILLEYIKTKSNDATFLHNKEVLKTINTLSFVIGHMESELKTKCIYLEEKDWNSCHYVKNK